MIPHRPLGRTELQVSVLGYGGAPIGFAPEPNEAAFVALLRRAFELGINFYDTAPDYRDSERLIGRAFRTHRAEVILATKVGRVQERNTRGEWDVREDWSEAGVLRTVERSLRQLDTDYLDLVQLHSPPLWVLEEGAALRGLQCARQQGKLRHIGISADGAQARHALEIGGFATLQTSYSVLQQEPGDDLLDTAVESGVGLIIKQPVANGIPDLPHRPEHTDWRWKWDVAQCMDLSSLGEPGRRTEGALRWLLADSRISTAIVGTARPEHLERNAAAAADPLDPEQFEQLRREYRSARSLDV